MISPKFEFICKSGDGCNKVFTLKNISSVIVSNITPESFILTLVDNSLENIMPLDFQMATSLCPNETTSIQIENHVFKQRGIGYRKFQFMFSMEDEQSNKYYCIATKNVEKKNDYMIGKWDTCVKEIDDNTASKVQW